LALDIIRFYYIQGPLAKRYLPFYTCHWPYISHKTSFLYLIFAVLYHLSCIDASFYFLVQCTYSLFSKWRPSAIGFSYFRNICQKYKFSPISMSTGKIWWRSDDPWPSYCVFSIFKLAAVHHFRFSYFLLYLSIQICAYFYIDVQNSVKIGRFVTELLHIFDFQNGGRPSWIW